MLANHVIVHLYIVKHFYLFLAMLIKMPQIHDTCIQTPVHAHLEKMKLYIYIYMCLLFRSEKNVNIAIAVAQTDKHQTKKKKVAGIAHRTTREG